MNEPVILRATVNGVEMLFPMEKRFRNMPRIGERLSIGDVFGPYATVTMVTHYIDGFRYPGTVMRRCGVKSRMGVDIYFATILDVELDDNFYESHDFETWHEDMGWDKSEWLKVR